MGKKLSVPRDDSPGDIANALAKGVVGAVPIVGSVLAETFGQLLAPPYHKRLCEFLEQVAERLYEHEVRLEDVVGKEEFVSAVRSAAETALKTHDQLKREMLVNAVTSIGVGADNLADDVRQIFLRMIDQLTPLHLKILVLFQDPRDFLRQVGAKYEPAMTSSIDALIAAAIPELRGQNDLTELIYRDLADAGLLGRMSTIHTMMSATGAFAKRTTSFGEDFVQFTLSDK